jgi:short-subunit dehydrogenase
MMSGDQTGKVVLVTGASAGLGASVARELARRRCRLAVTARRGERLERLAGELRGQGVEVLVLPADLGEVGVPERLVAETVARFGGLDVLINNAGFGLPTLFARAEPAAIHRQLEVNLVAPLLLARWALPHLIARRGTIINVGSAITSVANPALGAYGATKAGLAYWNDALRRELRQRGVRVCLVEPGPIATEFFSAMAATAGATGGSDPLVALPSAWMSARVEDVAGRIARLVDRPRRRVSVLRRVVWPFRLIGGLFQVWPGLGDLAVSTLARDVDRDRDLPGDRAPALLSGSLGDAQPSD